MGEDYRQAMSRLFATRDEMSKAIRRELSWLPPEQLKDSFDPNGEALSGLELIEVGLGPGFASKLFVSTEGSAIGSGDGTLYQLSGSSELMPFLSNIDAIDVAFDTEGILGGGMFASDGTNRSGPGKIWRVTLVPAPPT